MSERELREKTSCSEINTEQGNLVNSSTTWNITSDLVAMIDVPMKDLKCQKRTERINAFLPIPELTRMEAEDLCHKFGEDAHIAGQFNSKEDFDHYYDGKYRQATYLYINLLRQFIYAVGYLNITTKKLAWNPTSHYIFELFFKLFMYFYFVYVYSFGRTSEEQDVCGRVWLL